jgi:phosphatidylserine decarboxylase
MYDDAMLDKSSLFDKLLILLQYIIPQHALSRLIFYLTRLPLGIVTHAVIRYFIYFYGVDMRVARWHDACDYKTFNHFFTRALMFGVRPVADVDVISPVDGEISQIGDIKRGYLLQAKGCWFRLVDLLAQSADECCVFQDGSFCTFYLSPRDYHRVHIPIAGRLIDMIYVPGRLFSVNQRASRVVAGLFARNERVICYFETTVGIMAVILVGALLVGSIETVWAGVVTPNHYSQVQRWNYSSISAPFFNQGEEIGRFNMGSTVIILFQARRVIWLPHLIELSRCRVGEGLARRLPCEL